jgi:DNA-binding NtrC family response regulator
MFLFIVGILLIVDDSMVIIKIIKRYMNDYGVTTYSCINGKAAKEWLIDHHEQCCAVITDLEMPEIRGDALIKFIQSTFPDILCFLATGDYIVPEKLPEGTRRVIVKPVTQAHIYEVVNDIFEFQNASSTS